MCVTTPGQTRPSLDPARPPTAAPPLSHRPGAPAESRALLHSRLSATVLTGAACLQSCAHPYHDTRQHNTVRVAYRFCTLSAPSLAQHLAGSRQLGHTDTAWPTCSVL
ncbi:hypothetical protein AAFF_G00099010 [Aldrovandia affinis]|uniref:Uncharacterized protein n=1 Tax=Aldrovandia affinis TaxID=143900 RepID=A0AAD7RUS7_9TELE|nr:hypothetical protein AAFF_G00099010 [Aldrovandia affinis]